MERNWLYVFISQSKQGWGGERVGPPCTTAPAGLKAAPSPPLPPTQLPSSRPLSPQSLQPLSLQPPPPQAPVPPRPDSPPLAKPDRAEPAADTRNQPPRPRPRLTLTGCPSQSTPTCLHPPPILYRELQTGALFGQWRQGAGSCVVIPPARAGREGGMKEPIMSRKPRPEQPILGLKMKWAGIVAR
ncbi:vegetative cell wall protein gp1-like [Pteropus vampyrus]|uniref:Vegetative cell wall protein gp1-like n=1 Tax=Pteropus vampyrus TaxID=132908 RepID=A0A6P6CFD5_PTEVA|nr:vegetative cell wall protein gp1-like [Pteropus vampyrus]